jgi:hypothetical protein
MADSTPQPSTNRQIQARILSKFIKAYPFITPRRWYAVRKRVEYGYLVDVDGKERFVYEVHFEVKAGKTSLGQG